VTWFKSRGSALACAALVILNLAVYWPVVGFGFVDLDDPAYVTENANVASGITWRGAVVAFTSITAANWHPVTMLSHMADVQVFGLWAGGHHLTNLFLHIANTLLLFGLLRRTTGTFGGSLFVAALFAVHPLHVESVAWISERKDVLSTFFALLCVWAYVSFVRAPSAARYVRVVLWFALALMAKPMVVTLPFLLLLLDVWPLNRSAGDTGPRCAGDTGPRPGAWPPSWRAGRPLVTEKLPLFLLAAAASVITFMVQDSAGAVGSTDRLPIGVRAGHALLAYWTYLRQTIWPSHLAVFYPFQEGAISFTWAGAAALGLAALSALALRSGRRFPFAFTGWFWFVGLLVPVIGIVHIGNHWTADRYTYVPIVGLFLVVGWGVPAVLARWTMPRLVLPAAAVVAVSACAIVATAQVSTWRDAKSLWQHALAVTTDNYLAHGTLGALLVNEGRMDEGIAHLNEWRRLRQGFAVVENDRGDVLARQGQLDEAMAHFAQAVKINPGMPEAHVNLGFALARMGRIQDAIRALEVGLRLEPNQPEVRCNLAVLYHQQGNTGEARRQLEAALSVAPGYPRAVRMLADLAKGGG